MSWKIKRQDRQTQRMFDNVTKSLLDKGNGLKRDPETGVLYEEPLKEEHPVGNLLLLRGSGPALAKGLQFIGEKTMPSALLKGVGQTFPKLAKATTAISPYADAGAMATWGAAGLEAGKQGIKEGDTSKAVAGYAMAAMPLMGVNPEIPTNNSNKVARALNREIKGTDFKMAGDADLSNKDLFYHLDFGDGSGAFSSGATIKNGKLFPGQTTVTNQKNYTWWNLGKPYAEGVNNKHFTRLITTSKNPKLINVRSQTDPIGQWNGKSGFVTKSEYVSSEPIDINNIYDWDGSKWVLRNQNHFLYQEPTLKQTRVVSEGTYPLYTGPKHSVTEVVNPDGTVNPRAALRIEREVADNIPGAYRMESRLENPEWHVNDPNTWAHTRNVAQSAWTVPTSKGLTKQDQMITALGHDFGKMVSGDGHAQSSAALIEQIFPDVTGQQLIAISEHMGAPKSILGKVTKQADILNGKPAITRFVGNNGKIRLRLSSHTVEKPRELVLDPQGNNKFRVHTRTWDGDHIPAEMSGEDKNTLFNALYEELPEGAEILFPESGPGNYATRGTVAGLQRLARDSRFTPTSKGILQYVDKDGSIKSFEGTGFKKLKQKQGGILKGQPGGSIIPMNPLTWAKYQAYKIVTDPNVWWKAGANLKDIAKNFVRLTPVMEDQNKAEFIFGVKRPETIDGEAYDWAKDIEENNYKNVKSYEGVLNPYNEYIIGEKYKSLVENLADSGYSTSLNINDEYSDPETGMISKDTPYFDDVHGYRIRFHRDKDGNPVISASDLYDFGKNYTEGFKDLNIERGGNGNIEWQRKALNLVGQPYKLVQHNIPIKFVNDNFPSNRKKSFEIQVLNK